MAPAAEAEANGFAGEEVSQQGPSGLRAAVTSEVNTVLKAAQRVAAMALVDASISIPQAKRVCDAALSALGVQPSSGNYLNYRPSSTKVTALLVLCHPSEGESLCSSLADIWAEELERHGIEAQRLYLGNRSAAYTGLSSEKELKAALGKAEAPPSVKQMQQMVEDARFLIFVHPIFWFDVPSQLKGFLESVLSSGFAYRKLPSCWTLNRAVGIMERLPVVPSLLKRYSAYGFLRDKVVWITRTMGGPEAGPRFFGHSSSSLESTMQFVGAHIAAVDTVAEIDDTTREAMAEVGLPTLRRQIAGHCRKMASAAATLRSQSTLAIEDKKGVQFLEPLSKAVVSIDEKGVPPLSPQKESFYIGSDVPPNSKSAQDLNGFDVSWSFSDKLLADAARA